ncbi:MAG TPA: hypothetical protein VGA13_05105 [Acidimicrobiales bacterium]|jgi:hypothetical protein
MSWADFDTDSALERDLIERALSLVPVVSDGSSSVTIDMTANTAQVAVTFGETLGPSPSGCVRLLGIRPLLVGAAWKVIDLLLEEALRLDGEMPDTRRGWSITRKVSPARAADARPAALAPLSWQALMTTYAGTSEVRHSLVHRRAHTDASDALVGVDDSGVALRPLAPDEQDALARAALRASQLVISATTDDRVAADLDRQLGALSAVHGVALPVVALTDSLPEIAALLDLADDGSYPFDVPGLRGRQPFKGATFADLVVRFRDRPGQELRGRLENAPDQVVHLDPDHPPAWLT